MSSPIDCAELTGPKTCERLHLITTRKKSKLLWIGFTNALQALAQHCECIVPRNGFKFTRTTLGTRFT